MYDHDGYGAELMKREALIDQAVGSFPSVFSLETLPSIDFRINREGCFWDEDCPMLDIKPVNLDFGAEAAVYQMTPEHLRRHILPATYLREISQVWCSGFLSL
jgi:hypothetical protein